LLGQRTSRETTLRQTFHAPTFAALAVALALLVAPSLARAQDDPFAPRKPGAPPAAAFDAPKTKLEWRYPTFQVSEYFATGGFMALAVGGILIPTPEPRWTGDNAIDSGARDALRLPGRNDREVADDVSDVLLTMSLNYVLFDSFVVAWLGYDKGSVAYQMTAIDVETLAFTAGVTSIFKGVIARERPYVANCAKGGYMEGTDDCDPQTANRSFFSNHTAQAFAVAGLTCSHHLNLPLYGGGAADGVACAGAFGVAGVTGVLRVMSDNHNLTDVVVGGSFGALAGLGLPWLLHYRRDAPPPEGVVARSTVNVQFVPGPLSGTLVGTF